MTSRCLVSCSLSLALLVACGGAGGGGSATYTLTLQSTGGGAVRSTPAAIECLERCTESSAAFTAGTRVSLVAQGTGARPFAGWGGDCAGLGSCELTLDRDRTVSADFAGGPGRDGGPLADGGPISPDGGAPLSLQLVAPTSGALVGSATVDVVARITSAANLDSRALLARFGTVGGALINAGGDLYQATLPMASLPTGRYPVWVQAVTVDGVRATASHEVLYDAGPLISVTAPTGVETVRDALSYDFRIDLPPELQGQATLEWVSATVDWCIVPLGAPTAGRYTGTFRLSTCTRALNPGRKSLIVVTLDSLGSRSERSAEFVFQP